MKIEVSPKPSCRKGLIDVRVTNGVGWDNIIGIDDKCLMIVVLKALSQTSFLASISDYLSDEVGGKVLLVNYSDSVDGRFYPLDNNSINWILDAGLSGNAVQQNIHVISWTGGREFVSRRSSLQKGIVNGGTSYYVRLTPQVRYYVEDEGMRRWMIVVDSGKGWSGSVINGEWNFSVTAGHFQSPQYNIAIEQNRSGGAYRYYVREEPDDNISRLDLCTLQFDK